MTGPSEVLASEQNLPHSLQGRFSLKLMQPLVCLRVSRDYHSKTSWISCDCHQEDMADHLTLSSSQSSKSSCYVRLASEVSCRVELQRLEYILDTQSNNLVTPFASILKSIWYRMNYPRPGKKTLLSKIYFIHICRDSELQFRYHVVVFELTLKYRTSPSLDLQPFPYPGSDPSWRL